MFFHSVNAYDFVDPKTSKVTIHVDLCSYEAGDVPYREYCFSNILDPARPFTDGTLVRYELADVDGTGANPVMPGRVTVAAAIPGVAAELPRIAKSASARPGYRYVYFTAGNGGASPGTQVPIGRLGNGLKTVQAAFFGSLAKSDWKTGRFVRWQPAHGESCPCEPVFVQRPGAADEDDGVVLTIVINREGTHSILVALDGKSFTEVARADMPQGTNVETSEFALSLYLTTSLRLTIVLVYALGPHGSFVEGEFGA